jgi:hypothetical protein
VFAKVALVSAVMAYAYDIFLTLTSRVGKWAGLSGRVGTVVLVHLGDLVGGAAHVAEELQAFAV